MTTKLALFNGALRALGERKLSALTDDVPYRYELDTIYDDDFVKEVLEQGQWKFAMRTVRIDYDSSLEPEFGFQRVFSKPTDWVRTTAISANEYFTTPLNSFNDEGDYFYADIDILYLRYISDDSSYGGDLSRWPKSFTRYAQLSLAFDAHERIGDMSAAKVDRLERRVKKARSDARSKDAINGPASFPPINSWARARRGGSSGRDIYRHGDGGLS